MDATHFRQRAARAREMAQSGEDLKLSRMLLEVALDLDAEADAIEASTTTAQRSVSRVQSNDVCQAILNVADRDDGARHVQIVNLSAGGAKFRVDGAPVTNGSRVVLEFPGHAVRLAGTIVRLNGAEAAMVFDPNCHGDPDLSRMLLSEFRPDDARA